MSIKKSKFNFSETFGGNTTCTDYDVRLQPDSFIQGGVGKLQMCFNSGWRDVCHDGLDGSAPEVICNLMGYQRLGIPHST